MVLNQLNLNGLFSNETFCCLKWNVIVFALMHRHLLIATPPAPDSTDTAHTHYQ